MNTHSVSKTAKWLRNRLDVRLGVELWALELEAPHRTRRPRKFTAAARLLGRLVFLTRHRHAPKPEGCACLAETAPSLRGEAA